MRAQEEAERRLASAKRRTPPPAGGPAKRRRPGHEFEEARSAPWPPLHQRLSIPPPGPLPASLIT